MLTPIHPVNRLQSKALTASRGKASAVIQGASGIDQVSFKQRANAVRFASAGRVASLPGYLNDLEKRGIMVVGGGGIMGSGISQNALTAGVPVYIQEYNEAAAKGALDRIKGSINEAASKGVYSKEEAEQFNGLLRDAIGGKIEEVVSQVPKNVGVVIEAIFEDMNMKKNLFKVLDAHLDPDAILATNTSTLSVTEMASVTNRPDKVVGLHFFKPPQKNRFVEVIAGDQTSEDTIRKAMTLVRAMGKTPIFCKDAPGFVVNRLGIPLVNEGVKMLDEGFANPSTVDQVALETLWPTYHKKYPQLKDKALLPFRGSNQDNYQLIMGQTTQIIHDVLRNKYSNYGNSYLPTPTVLAKSKAYKEIEDTARKEGVSREELQKRLAAIKYNVDEPIQDDKKAAVRDRFLGLVFGVATQLLQEGVTTPADVDRGVQVGLAWEVGPFELMNKMGPAKALQLVKAYQEKFNPEFVIPQVLWSHALENKPFALSLVDSRKEGNAQYITINRPQKMNAFDGNLLEDLRTAFRAAEQDPSVKTIVIESVGGKAYSAGADIFSLMDQVKAVMRANPPLKLLTPQGLVGVAKRFTAGLIQNRSGIKGALVEAVQPKVRNLVQGFLNQGRSVFDEIAASNKVTVAKVNGIFMGGGGEVALACDYIVASDKAEFALPELKYGIFPAWGGTERLSRKVGPALAKFIILEGGKMNDKGKGDAVLDAKTAQIAGLVDMVVPAAHLDDAVTEALAAGKFSEKWKPAPDDTVGAGLKDLSASPLLKAKAERYATASMKDLLRNELKDLHPGAVKLAFDRIESGTTRLTESEVSTMLVNMDAVKKSQSAKKPKK